MLRRAAAIPFAVALAFAGCGHQVTPSPTTTDLSGDLVIDFETSGSLDFQNVTYLIAVDTCGNGVPYPQAELTGFQSYSYGFFVGGQFGAALPKLFQYYLNPNGSGQFISVQVLSLNPSTTQFVPNLGNQPNEFQLTFPRSDFENPLAVPQPCPNTAGLATASPSATPSAGASPAPTATPVGQATTWIFNFITVQNNQPVDSLGIGGANDTSFQGVSVDTTTNNSQQIVRAAGSQMPSNPSAAIIGGEIQNFP